MTRFRWLLLLVCCLVLPATARADGIDLPILLVFGIGIFLPLLLFNATVEAPIVGRVLGMKFSEVWWPWFKANIWSLLSGIPVLVLTSFLKDWLVPTELGRRVRVYPWFLVLGIVVYYVVTVLVEWACASRLARRGNVHVASGRLLRAVSLANVASYLVLGPVFYYHEYPRSDVREFTADTRWAQQPALTVVAVSPSGHLEAARADGQERREVIPYGVRDYVVSADLGQALYRGSGDRLFLFQHGTNIPIPELGLWCRAPEMDFSPDGRYAAFIGRAGEQIILRVYDTAAGKLRDVPHFGRGSRNQLAWSTRADSFYLRSDTNYWEISLGPEVSYARLSKAPDDLADHYGRVGPTQTREGAFYGHHKEGGMELHVFWGLERTLRISGPMGRVMMIRDPAGWLGMEQAVFLDGGRELLVGLGGYVYLGDIAAKRLGPVMPGEKFIALTTPFSKRVGF